MKNINVFNQFPDCIVNRTKMKGILSDLFPTEKVKVNLIMNAYDEGIVEAINNANELNTIMFTRWKRIVIDNYGISDENADWVIDYWFSEYGMGVCGKTYKKSIVKKANVSYASEKKKIQLPAGMCVNISKLKDGEKLPKEIIDKKLRCDGVDIQSMNCSIRKDFEYNGVTTLKFTGEYAGSSKYYVLIMVTLYNANDELVAFSSDEEIAENFRGQASFSDTIRVPSDEYISKAVVRLILDPAFI